MADPHLWNLLKEHLGWYPYHIFSNTPTTIDSPYQAIVFSWDILQQAAEQAPTDDTDKQARDDLKLLLDSISSGSSGDARLDKYFKTRRSTSNGEDAIGFQDLWTVFPPGTLVYGRPFQGQDQVFIVKDNRESWPSSGYREHNSWSLRVWSYDWKNGSFGRNGFELVFQKFDGFVPLTSLEYYPFNLHPKYHDVWKKLVDRGKEFQKLCNAESRLFEYDGEALLEQRGFTGLIQDDVCFQDCCK